jgi:hypothetical protein
MSGLAWDKFFWSDYASDPGLKICSFAAQGLWMRMLCIASEHEPRGYVAVNGNGLDARGIARATGGELSEVNELLEELESNGVFSRDRRSWIYSRRMINDTKKREKASELGKKGALIRYGKDNGKSGTLKGEAQGNPKGNPMPQKPEARVQKEKESSNDDSKKTRLPEGFEPEPFGEGTAALAIEERWTVAERKSQFEAFCDHHRKEGSRFVDWQAVWGTWVRNSDKFKRRDQRQESGPGDYLKHIVDHYPQVGGARR